MKKVVLCSVLLGAALMLTSCKVNWFGDTLDVPWYYIAIPILLIAVCGYFILMANRYVCPHCGTEFKAKPYDLSVTVHMMGKRLAKCPHCGKRSFCRIKR